MVLMCLLLLADAGAKVAEVSGGMSLISSEFITAMFTGIIGVISAVLTKHSVERKFRGMLEAKDEEIKNLKLKIDLPQPLEVKLKEEFVTRHEYEDMTERNDRDHKEMREDNSRDHENIFNRLTVADKSLGNIQGLLEGIRGDLTLIKGKLFKK